MDTYPAAYLRRSYVDPNSPGDISREAQRAAVAKLAHADGHNGDVVEYDDWGVSADVAKSAHRTAYSRLLADMEAGKVSAVYAFDVDRLYRDPRDLIRLQDAAQRHAVRIVTTAGPLAVGEGDDPAAEAFAFIGAVFGRMELQKAKKRARAAREARRTRGDRFGHPPYGFRHVRDASGRIVREPDPTVDLGPILAAYRDAGSVLGACELLKARGVRAPKGGTRWSTSALTRILQRMDPALLPHRTRAGRRTPGHAAFAGLLRCPFCGTTMTPNGARGQYYCRNGARDRATHPRYVVLERDLLPWVREEADRFDPPGEDAANVPDLDARRTAIDDTFRRASRAYMAGGLTDDEYDAAQRERDAALATLADSEYITVEPVDFDWPPEALNAGLRALWTEIRLDAAMHPTEAAWRVPEWRRP